MVKLVKIIKNDPKNKSTTYLGDDGNQYTLKGDLSERANNSGNISPSKKGRAKWESQFEIIGYLPSSKGQPEMSVFSDVGTGRAVPGKA